MATLSPTELPGPEPGTRRFTYPSPGETVELLPPGGTETVLLVASSDDVPTAEEVAACLPRGLDRHRLPPEQLLAIDRDRITPTRAKGPIERPRGLGEAGASELGEVVAACNEWRRRLADRFEVVAGWAVPHRSR